MPAKLNQPTEQQVRWEVKKANDKVEKIQKKLDGAIVVLNYWVQAFKNLYPEKFQELIAQQERDEHLIKTINEEADRKAAAKAEKKSAAESALAKLDAMEGK